MRTSFDAFSYARRLAVQADGKLVAVGGTGAGGGPTRVALARYLPDGRLDPAFGDGGRVVARIGGMAGDVVLQRDGRTLVAVGADRLARFGRDGALDTSFGDGGLVVTGHAGSRAVPRRRQARRELRPRRRRPAPAGGGGADHPSDRPRPFAVAVQPDRKIVVAGGTGPGGWFEEPRDFALARYLPPRCVVPALRGRTSAAAGQALLQAGCRLGTVRAAYSAVVPRGRVISQRPAARAGVPEDTHVAVVVSRGPRR